MKELRGEDGAYLAGEGRRQEKECKNVAPSGLGLRSKRHWSNGVEFEIAIAIV
jgi:hypothetical protein